jgi:ABC-type polysaccharide/polyol phosphate export permease
MDAARNPVSSDRAVDRPTRSGAHPMISNLRTLTGRRDLLWQLVVTDLRASTAQTFFGWLWWLIDPLLMMVIYWIVVAKLLGRGLGSYDPYPVFILSGLIAWKHLATSVSKSTKVLRSRESLIKSVPFPTMVLPLSVVLSGFAYFLFGFIVVLGAAFLFSNANHSGDWLPLIQLVPLMLGQVAVTTGICLILSCFGVLLRDLEMFASYALRVAYYLSPGLFGVDLVHDKLVAAYGTSTGETLLDVYMLNPYAVLLQGYREAIFYGRFIPAMWWVMLAVEATVVLYIGYLVYQHYDRRVIKFL